MLYQENKSFLFTELKASFRTLIWGVAIIGHGLGLFTALNHADKHGGNTNEVFQNFVLWGIFLALLEILSTLKQILKNSNRGL